MKKNLVKKTNNVWWQETIDTPETEYVEENFYVEETLVKNKELIRMEMNLIQLPIFSKNTKRKVNQVVKYFFNSNRDTYITVTPTAGNYIPGEMEEKVFIALMQIMKEKGMPKQFIISGTELRDKLKLNTGKYGDIVRSSLLRLSETNYKFKNTMYSSELKGTIKKEVSTPILTLEIITLSLKQNEKYRKSFDDKRIKEVYKITITDHFYSNIIQKGYMVYSSRILLDINTSTARTIYMLIEKLRFEKIELKIDTIFLIKRIPLKFDKAHLSQTMKTLKKAFEELKAKNLIEDFKIIKESTWEKSEIEIFFHEKSQEEKQQRFFEDRNDFTKLLTQTAVSDTEHEMIEDAEVVEKSTNLQTEIKVTQEMIDKILGLMPSKARTLKTMPKTIKDSIIEYGYSKVEAVAIYMKKNKVEKVRAYFIKALENNWCEDEAIVIQTPKKEVLNVSHGFLNKDETPKNYEKELEYFNSLSTEEKEKLEEKVYRAYIEECGQESKIQKLTFNAAKNRLIAEFISKNNLVKKEVPKEKDVDLSVIDDINYYTEYISKNVELYRSIFNLSEERIREIKKEVLMELGTKIISKSVTLEEINLSIAKKLK
ncbi:hypothetical protein [Candidatus Cetobacterium colombiensis]|uniref:Initiator Rep protein domain-containing protein n=1 Tax=Candidatus Cetobacterium colombiensis TaxID=3073100 RepID=A0ABU4WCT2_9FUSO|nr:hypothetical protein [Candidatus Cetobacterium colombiensis]MDX8337333.1 hypothetical protein [Candidatus Cetobacterium colombiensis]